MKSPNGENGYERPLPFCSRRDFRISFQFHPTSFSHSGRDMPKILRETAHISRKLTQNIFRAFDYARARGIPLNLFVVINIRETDACAAATAFERIRHKYRDWLAHHSHKLGVRIPPMYVFTFEAPGNPHVNWVLRVPPRLVDEFKKKLPGWVEKVQGPSGPFDIDVQTIGPDGAYKALANYIVKGCDPLYVEHFHLAALAKQYGPQGAFWGRRAGVSPSLNKAEREAAGFNPKRRELDRTAA